MTTLKTWQKFFIGGVGGAIPLIMNLLIVDYQTVLTNLTFYVGLGYSIRFLVFFSIGGFWAALHTETNKKKIFELGIIAPALITAMINAGNIKQADFNPAEIVPPSAKIFFINDALAQETTQPEELQTVKKFQIPPETQTQQFFRGLIGAEPANTWFVIVGSYRHENNAQRQAKLINRAYDDFQAEVYAPYGDNPFYTVVIGANLSQNAAQNLRDKALKEGLAEDAYLWTFPK
ncbi:MAG: SPOR domain-containing protein [Pseudomonadota bacterium]